MRLRHERVAALGLQPLTVLEAVQAAYEGAAGRADLSQGSQVVGSGGGARSGSIASAVTEVGALPLRNPDGRLLRLADVADIEIDGGRYKILHAGGRRLQTVTANVEGRDIAQFERDARTRVGAAVKSVRGQLRGLRRHRPRAGAGARPT